MVLKRLFGSGHSEQAVMLPADPREQENEILIPLDCIRAIHEIEQPDNAGNTTYYITVGNRLSGSTDGVIKTASTPNILDNADQTTPIEEDFKGFGSLDTNGNRITEALKLHKERSEFAGKVSAPDNPKTLSPVAIIIPGYDERKNSMGLGQFLEEASAMQKQMGLTFKCTYGEDHLASEYSLKNEAPSSELD